MTDNFEYLMDSDDDFLLTESIFIDSNDEDHTNSNEDGKSHIQQAQGASESSVHYDELSETDQFTQNSPDDVSSQKRPSHIRLVADKVRANLLPKKSAQSYICAYKAFEVWMTENEITSDDIDQDVMLAYFQDLKENKKYKPTTMWSTYSKLRSVISTNHNINIHQFKQLIQFLKNEQKGFHSIQAMALTEEQASEFLNTAPDDLYLDVKVQIEY